MTEKIGILGGAFNPPHRAHLVLAETAIRELSLNRLIFIPAKDPPHKIIEGRWDFNTRSLMIKTAAFCISPNQLSRALENFSGNKKEAFLEQYEMLYQTHFRPEFSVLDVEEARPGKSYTIDTIKILLEKNPNWKIYLIIGMDQAAVFDTWKDWEELSRITVICAADRLDYSREEVKKKFPFIRILDFPRMDVSSTELRNGTSKAEDLPETVRGLISIIS